ncbi:MAG: DUF6383 domain-containing protein [Bacteroidales bacterium]|nr:DUF6383 domain-containing protein [Bacteroidales bacterium]
MKKTLFIVLIVLTNIVTCFSQNGYYSCDFEDVHENARWHALQPNVSKWYIGSAVNNGGSNSLYISPNGGVSNSNSSSACIALAYRELYLNSGTFQISFDHKFSNGSIYYSYLKVVLIPSSQQFELNDMINPNYFEGLILPQGTIEVSPTMMGRVHWYTENYNINIMVPQWYKMCFVWRRAYDPYTSIVPPAIDNISIAGPSPSSTVFVGLDIFVNNYPDNVAIVGGGTYNYMDTAEVKVSVADHYHITGWSNQLLPFYVSPAMDSLAIWMDGNYSLTVNVAKDTHIVSVASRGGPVPSVTNGGLIPWMESCTVTASTNDSYWRFLAWGNGVTANPYTFTVTNDTTITAIYLAPNESAHRLQVLCSIPGSGTIGISGSTQIYGEFYQDGLISLSAIANYGYHFVQWSDGNTTNPRTINLTQDTYLTAIFAPNQYSLSVLTNDASMGTVAGSGTFNYLTQTTITAMPATHCHFVQWADGNTSNPRLITVTQDASYTAIFAQDPQYAITVSVNDPSRGSADGGGIFFAGDYVTLSAYPNEHYYFSSWSDGVNANPYYLTVIENASYTAMFEPINYNVNLTCNDDYMGSVCGGGSYPYGSTANIEAQPFDGFRFIEWSDGNTNASRSLLVEGNISLQASFGDAHTEGIDDVVDRPIMTVVGSQIVVSGAAGQTITVYDVIGRKVVATEKATDRQELTVPASGVYIVKIDGYKSLKCVVR